MQHQHRHLAAIFFSDIAGYTSLMGQDEDRAFRAVAQFKSIAQPLVNEYQGRWHKDLGDGALCSFDSALDAVQCAIVLQQRLHADSDFKVRIGIHLGDVTFQNGDVFGDGVNVASRLHAEAAAGGICVSEAVFKTIRNKDDIRTIYLGNRKLKHVNESLKLYQVQGKGVETTSALRMRKIPWMLFTLIGLGLLILGFFIGKFFIQKPLIVGPTHVSISFPKEAPLSLIGSAYFGAGQRAFDISPDGKLIVYVAQISDTITKLFLRRLNSFEVASLSGTEGAFYPFFSPDGQWIGFFTRGALKKVSINGTEPIKLCSVTHPYGATWSENGDIVIANNEGLSLEKVSSSQNSQEKTIIPLEKRFPMYWPSILPDQKHVLVTSLSNVIHLVSLESGKCKELLKGASNAKHLATGHVVFSQWNRLMIVPFSIRELKLDGNPEPLLDHIRMESLTGASQYAVSKSGTLVYVPGNSMDKGELVFVDRKGNEIQKLSLPADYYGTYQLSPDNKYLAYTVQHNFNNYMSLGFDIWIYDLQRQIPTLFEKGSRFSPLWDPEGEKISFTAYRAGTNFILEKSLTSNNIDTLVESKHELYIWDWSPDKQFLLYTDSTYYLRAFLPRTSHKDNNYLRSKAPGFLVQFAPNSKYVSYTSALSGQYEIWVEPFPQTGYKRQISMEGGLESFWSHDGKEIFYRSLDNKKMMVVPVQWDPDFNPGKPVELWRGEYLDIPGVSYDVTRDSKLFLMKKSVETQHLRTDIRVIQNWFEEIGKHTVVRE